MQKLKGIRRKILAFVIAIFMVANNFVLSTVSTAMDDTEKTIDTSKVHNTVTFELEKYVNYNVENQKGALVQLNVKPELQFDEGVENVNSKAVGVLLKTPKINNEFPQSVETIGNTLKLIYDSTVGELKVATTGDFKVLFYYGENCYMEKVNNGVNTTANTEKPKIELTGKINTQLDVENNPIITSEYTKTIELEEKSGLISADIQTTPIYNGFIKNKKATQYKENYDINISKIGLGDETILEIDTSYGNDKINYLSGLISKDNVLDILGINGALSILDAEQKEIAKINKDTTVNEKGLFEITYPTNINKIFIKITKPEKLGKIRIQNDKQIPAEVQDKTIDKIDTTSNIKIINKKEIEQEVVNQVTNQNETITKIEETPIYNYQDKKQINIENSSTQVNLSIEDNKYSWTNERQNELNFVLELPINSDKYNLFKNPTISIKLPEEVEKAVLKENILNEAKIINANGLQYSAISYDAQTKSINIELTGEQKEYFNKDFATGTTLTIPAIVILNQGIQTKETTINVAYTNNITVEKNGEPKEAIETGSIQVNVNVINFNAPTLATVQAPRRLMTSANPATRGAGEEITVQGLNLEVVAKKGNTVLTEENPTVYEGEFIKYEIAVTNNTSDVFRDVKIVPTFSEDVTCVELVRKELVRYDEENEFSYYNETQVEQVEIPTINPGETKKLFFEVKVKDLAEGIDTKDISTKIEAKIGDGLAGIYNVTHQVQKAENKIELSSSVYTVKNEVLFKLNINKHLQQDSTVKIQFPEYLKPISYQRQYDTFDYPEVVPDENTYSSVEEMENNLEIYSPVTIETEADDNNILTIQIEKGPDGRDEYVYHIIAEVDLDKIWENPENENKTEEEVTTIATLNNKYISNEDRYLIHYKNLKIKMDSDTAGQEISCNEEDNSKIKYTVTIKGEGQNNIINDGDILSTINLKLHIPEEIKPATLKYELLELDEDGNIISINEFNEEPKIINTVLDDDGNILPNIISGLDIPKNKTIRITITGILSKVNENKQITAWVETDNRREGTTINQNTENPTQFIQREDVPNKKSNEISHTILAYREGGENPDNPDAPDNPDDPTAKHTISGIAWLDENEDGKRQEDEQKLSNIEVLLINTNNEIVDTKTTNENGEYQFSEVENNQYKVIFKYDYNQYRLTIYQQTGVSENQNSDVIKVTKNINNIETTVAESDLIRTNKNLTNIDMGLILNKKFDFIVESYISKVTTTTDEVEEKIFNKAGLAKIEIKSKKINGAKVEVEYKIVVTNIGEIPGTIGKIVDYIPAGFEIASISSDAWTKDSDGSIVNRSLATKTIDSKESVELTLVLVKTMDENSTGTYKSNVEIQELSNKSNTKEESTENNSAKAELIISISTGTVIYISIGLIILLALIIMLDLKLHFLKNIKLRFFSLFIIASIITVGYSGLNDSHAGLIHLGDTKNLSLSARSVATTGSYAGGSYTYNGVRYAYFFPSSSSTTSTDTNYSNKERHRFSDWDTVKNCRLFYIANRDTKDVKATNTFSACMNDTLIYNNSGISIKDKNGNYRKQINRNGNEVNVLTKSDLGLSTEEMQKLVNYLSSSCHWSTGTKFSSSIRSTIYFLYVENDWAVAVQKNLGVNNQNYYYSVGLCLEAGIGVGTGNISNDPKSATVPETLFEGTQWDCNIYKEATYSIYSKNTIKSVRNQTSGPTLGLGKYESTIQIKESGDNYIIGPLYVIATANSGNVATVNVSSGVKINYSSGSDYLRICDSNGNNKSSCTLSHATRTTIYGKISKSSLANKTISNISITAVPINRAKTTKAWLTDITWYRNNSSQKFKTREIYEEITEDTNKTVYFNNIPDLPTPQTTSFKIKKVDESGNNLGAGFKFIAYHESKGWIKSNGQFSTNQSDAYIFTTGSNGETPAITGSEIYGRYIIVEIGIPDNCKDLYKLNSSISFIGKDNNKVTVTNAKLPDCTINPSSIYSSENKMYVAKDSTATITAKNIAETDDSQITLTGTVWEDGKRGKNQPINNNVLDSEDLKIKGLTVKLFKTGSGYIQTTTTDANGKYTFTNIDVKDLADGKLSITCEYDGVVYETIASDTGTEGKKVGTITVQIPKANTSKATEIGAARSGLNNQYLEITGTNLNKDKTCAKDWERDYTNKKVTIKTKETNKVAAAIDGTTLKNYYNNMKTGYSNNGSQLLTEIPNLNVGLIQREMIDLALKKDIYSANVKINGKSYTYYYGKKLDKAVSDSIDGDEKHISSIGVVFEDDNPLIPTDPNYKYCLPIYEADVEAFEDNDPKGLNVSITYAIGFVNNSSKLYGKINAINEIFSKKLSLSDVQVYSDKECTQLIASTNNGISSIPMGGKEYNSTKISLTNGVLVAPNSSQNLFIKFSLPRSELNDFINNELYGNDEFINYAEIASYSVYSDAGTHLYAAYDVDSTPNNFISGVNEDDDDSAPGLKLIKADERKISGVVFKDRDIDKRGEENEVLGDGIRQDEEYGISNVKVQLVEKISDTEENVIQEVTTTENGKYTFAGFIPGNYRIKYIWGDKQKSKINGETDIQTDFYKSTIVNYEKDQLGADVWFKASNQETNYSEAKDDYNLRKTYDEGNSGKLYQDLNMGAEAAEAKDMVSYTKDMNLDVEVTKDTKVLTYGDGTIKFVYDVKSIDLGLIERPKTQLEIRKQIERVQILSQDNTTLVDAKVDANNENKFTDSVLYATILPASNADPIGAIKSEIDIYPLKLVVTYKVTIENTSQIDYMNEHYYNYGHQNADIYDWEDDLCRLKPIGVYDYLDKKFETETSNVYKVINSSEFVNDLTAKYAGLQENKLTREKITAVEEGFAEYKASGEDLPNTTRFKQLQKMFDKAWDSSNLRTYRLNNSKVINLLELEGEELEAGDKIETTYTLKSTLSSSTDDINLNNQAEISYVDTTTERKKPLTTYSELNASAKKVIITKPTGGNKDYSDIIILTTTVIGSILILAMGIVIIKKNK